MTSLQLPLSLSSFHSHLNKQLQPKISQILAKKSKLSTFAIGGGFLNFNPIWTILRKSKWKLDHETPNNRGENKYLKTHHFRTSSFSSPRLPFKKFSNPPFRRERWFPIHRSLFGDRTPNCDQPEFPRPIHYHEVLKVKIRVPQPEGSQQLRLAGDSCCRQEMGRGKPLKMMIFVDHNPKQWPTSKIILWAQRSEPGSIKSFL